MHDCLAILKNDVEVNGRFALVLSLSSVLKLFKTLDCNDHSPIAENLAEPT